jgi:hypothetical protein
VHERARVPATVPPAVEAGVRTLRGRGRPLPEPVRQGLERSTGKRLAHVRVHDDSLSHTLSAAVAARAFTVGGDVALGAGAATPGLLAHELAHTAQQSATPAQGPLAATSPGDAIERQVGG